MSQVILLLTPPSLLILLILFRPSHGSPLAAAPVLNIDPNGISCGGISSGADFSVQFATAFSKHIMGVAVFAGQPFHCAATRFPLDGIFPCNETKPGGHAPVGPAGCQEDPFPLHTMPPSPPGEGLLWDHCKGCTLQSRLQLLKHPDLVDVSTLTAYARSLSASQGGLLDDVSHLSRTRSFVYRGTKDACYTDTVMRQTSEFFADFAADPTTQVRFVDDVPSLHCIPTLTTGTPCGTELHGPEAYAPHAMHGLEACGFDGPGEAMKHIYGGNGGPGLVPPPNASAIDPARIVRFGQAPYGMRNASSKDMAFADAGYMYVPERCEKTSDGDGKPCKLHIFFHGCGSAYNSGASGGQDYGFKDTFIAHGGWSAWGEANDIVVVYPQKDATKETCWDGYGWGGEEWATKRGGQMAAVWRLVDHIAGGLEGEREDGGGEKDCRASRPNTPS